MNLLARYVVGLCAIMGAFLIFGAIGGVLFGIVAAAFCAGIAARQLDIEVAA